MSVTKERFVMTKFKNVESKLDAGRPSTAGRRPGSAMMSNANQARRPPTNMNLPVAAAQGKPPTHVACGKGAAGAPPSGRKLTENALK